MAEGSKIEWTTHTFNPWWGCTKVSAACDNCYAETLAARFKTGWGKDAPRRFFPDKHWNEPLQWNRKAEGLTDRPRVFCASMADVFEDNDTLNEHRERLWKLIEATPNLDWLLLTKRPHLMTRLAPDHWAGRWPSNVWAMTTVEDQTWANARIPWLLQVPAVVHGLSMEPLVGPVDLSGFLYCPDCKHPRLDHAENSRIVGCTCGVGTDEDPICGCRNIQSREVPAIDWIITGGESGHGARPAHIDWYRSLRDQANAAGVAFHFKQWGNWLGADHGNAGEDWKTIGISGKLLPLMPGPESQGEEPRRLVRHVADKHDAGRLLDGRTWDQFPEVVTCG